MKPICAAACQRLPGVVSADAYGFGITPMSTIKAPVDIRLYAEDWRELPAAAAAVRTALAKVPGLTSVSTAWDDDARETILELDEDKLRAYNLSPEAVAAAIAAQGRQPWPACPSFQR